MEVRPPFGIRIASEGMCSNESGIESRRTFITTVLAKWHEVVTDVGAREFENCSALTRRIARGKMQLLHGELISSLRLRLLSAAPARQFLKPPLRCDTGARWPSRNPPAWHPEY